MLPPVSPPGKRGINPNKAARCSAQCTAQCKFVCMRAGDVWWTDANGMQMMPRHRSWRRSWPLHNTEPIAGNFYPFISAATIRGVPSNPLSHLQCANDKNTGSLNGTSACGGYKGVHACGNQEERIAEHEFSVVTDRPQAVASLQPGSMHVLLHRRLLQVCF